MELCSVCLIYNGNGYLRAVVGLIRLVKPYYLLEMRLKEVWAEARNRSAYIQVCLFACLCWGIVILVL